MTTSFTLNNIGTPRLSVSVEVAALSPEQKRDIVYAILRDSGLAYLPELREPLETLHECFEFYCSPTKARLPKPRTDALRKALIYVRRFCPVHAQDVIDTVLDNNKCNAVIDSGFTPPILCSLGRNHVGEHKLNVDLSNAIPVK